QGSDDSMMFVALGGVVIDVVACPLALGHGVVGKFVKALAEKFGAGLPEVNYSHFAAAFGHRGYSAKALRVVGGLKAGAIGAKEGQQTRSQGRSGAGQFGKEQIIWVIVKDVLDPGVVLFDQGIERLNDFRMHLAEAGGAFNDWQSG